MHYSSRRNFLKSGLKHSTILISSLFFFTNNYINKKIIYIKKKVYKKKFLKVWILKLNDN